MWLRRMPWAMAFLFVGFPAAQVLNGTPAQPSFGKTPGELRRSVAVTPQQAPEPRRPDVIYVPTPQEVVDAMLKLAKVTKDDVVYDLGCGDGRLVVTAARMFGARGVGVDIDPQRVREARENVEKAGVGDRVKIIQGDLFTTPIGEATVVTLYLLPSLNRKLIPKFNEELKPGTRIVSHAFDMGPEWPAEQELEVDGRHIYFWTMPQKKAGGSR